MTVSASVPATIQMRRRHLLGLLAAVGVVAGAVTWAVLAFAVNTGTETAARSTSKIAGAQQHAAVVDAVGLDPQSTRGVRSVMDLTPGDLAAGGLWGYALPSPQSGPILADVLASMSPESRRHVTTLMSLTFRQLAEGAAGYP